jgi:hypothetical protein
MTTNARALRDSSSDQTQFAKLPTTKEANESLELARQGQAQIAEAKKIEDAKILGKFKGQAELEQAYQQLEARFGQQGQEIGQLRSLTDKLLDLKTNESGTANGGRKEPVQVTSDELLRDPRAAIERVVTESTAGLQAQLAQEQHARVKAAFLLKHPTYEADMNDPAFHAFAKGSAYRTSLVQAAVANNVAAADELWNAWEEARPKADADKKKVAGEADRTRQLSSAALVSGGAGATGEGSDSGKPIYSRSALIQKRIQDPTGYYDPAFQEMISQAYIEKRVR